MSIRIAVLTAVMLSGAVGMRAVTQEAVPEANFARANRDAVARYLDARMDAWWAKAKPLKTGASEVKCLSCHTAVPYALARSAMRVVSDRVTAEPGLLAPTAHEERLLDTVRQRVAAGDAAQPYYDHTEAKKVESRGVEAVLNAVVLTRYDTLGRSGTGSDATRKAMARLWEVQRPDGAWDWLNFGLEPYEANDAVFHGAALAALAVGTSAGQHASRDATGQAGLARLRGYLRANVRSQRLFNRAWALLAETRLPGTLPAEDIAAIARDLLAAQRPDGGWALAGLGPWHWTKNEAPFAPPGVTDPALLEASDGYATGLAMYALRQAKGSIANASRPVPLEAMQKGRAWLYANLQPERAGDPSWAPWRAHSLNFDREHGGEKGEPWRRMFMSDLATTFAVLALID
jgi:squalene-hopene/tetraprenyl-beta-curcumene cyclase